MSELLPCPKCCEPGFTMTVICERCGHTAESAIDVPAVLRVADHLASCCSPGCHIGPVPSTERGGTFTTEFGCCCHIAAALRRACRKGEGNERNAW